MARARGQDPLSRPARNASCNCPTPWKCNMGNDILPPELFVRDIELFEWHVADRVLAPVLVVEVPPLRFKNGEALGFHCPAQQVAVPSLEGSAARIIGKGTRRHFVVEAGHLHGLTRFQVKQSEIDGASAVVA